MKTGARRVPPRPGGAPRPAPLPLVHPASLAILLLAAACVALAASRVIRDTDFWQHLAVGRAIWQLGEVPTTQLWSWPTYGAPDVNSSWGFRALIWPLWDLGGLWGLYLWRWIAALSAFAILYALARALGARGLSAFVACALCAQVYGVRAQIRPETLAAVLFAATLALLEWRRLRPGGGWWREAALVVIAWAWANSHISSFLWFALVGLFLAAGGASGRRRLALAAIAGLGAAWINPFGWRALAQPFEFFFTQRGRPIFEGIAELAPSSLRPGPDHLLPVLMALWLALLLWRWRRGFDPIEALLFLGLGALSLRVARFAPLFALAAFPYLARDLGEWIRSRRLPAWSATAAGRALTVAALVLAIAALPWIARRDRPRLALDETFLPAAACDFLERHDVRGRAFNPFAYGGYLLFRFWPDPGRLPFMDIHQSGTERHHADYLAAMTGEGWERVRDGYRIDYVLGMKIQVEGDRLLEALDRDRGFALVFVDDAAALYVRRGGATAAIADSFAYRVLAAGRAGLAALGRASAGDSVLRRRLEAELDRQARESPRNAQANSLLAGIALDEGRWSDARERLRAALRAAPATPRAHERLAYVALQLGELREAERELAIERRLDPRNPNVEPLRSRVRAARGAAR